MAKLSFKRKEKIKLIFRNIRYNSYVNVVVGLTCFGCENDLSKVIALEDDLKESDTILERIKFYNSKIYFISETFKEK